MARDAVDLLLHPRFLVPIAPENHVLERTSVAVRDGRIVAVGAPEALGERYVAEREIALDHHVVMPGLVNAHGHLAMSLLRGLGESQPLELWLAKTIWPLEGRWVDAEFVADGTRLAIAEMIASGTTTASDMYYFPETAAAVAREAGFRIQLAFPVIDIPNAWSKNVDECIHKGIALHDQYRSDDLVHVTFGPHAAYTVDDTILARVQALADEVDAGVQIHLHETAAEVAGAIDKTGTTWIKHFDAIGVLTPRLQAIHVTQVDDEEIEMLARAGSHVVHCPHSNLKLASGTCPITRLSAAGVNVALGTDGAASNNTLDLFQEMRTASLLAKGATADATSAPASDMLRAVTMGGARALGIDDLVGSVEPGKLADLIAIDVSPPALQPLHDVQAQLVHTNVGPHVSHTFIGGRCVYENGRFHTLDIDRVTRTAADWRVRMEETR